MFFNKKNINNFNKTNCYIQISLLLGIFENKILKEYFEKGPFLDSNKLLKEVKDNFLKLLHSGKIKDRIDIIIKGDLVFINNEIQANNSIIYNILIPYSEKNFIENYDKKEGFIWKKELHIRIIIINGEIHLQIGCFEPIKGFNLINDNSPKVHQQYYTISSFPIMYLYPELNFSKDFLNINLNRISLKNFIKSYDEKFRLFEEIKYFYDIYKNLNKIQNENIFSKNYDILKNKGIEKLKENNIILNEYYENSYENDYFYVSITNLNEEDIINNKLLSEFNEKF